MNALYQLERLCVRVRHSGLLKRAAPLWDVLSPLYNRVMQTAGSGGLTRNINGTDTIKLCPECRGMGEVYEPQVWARAMGHVKPGSRVIDVGAHVGLYAMAFGLRVKPGGQVLAAEPDPENLVLLSKHIELNGLCDVVTVARVALADVAATACLSMDSLQSHVSAAGSVKITLETLDALVGDAKWDLLLIDVEGHEEKVLRGGAKLLNDPARRPSMIIIEVHPYAWAELGMTSASLLNELTSKGYVVRDLNGSLITGIDAYGHIVGTHE